MKKSEVRRSKFERAFTLIELLVVIAIIAALAAMIIPITGAVSKARIRAKARAEKAQLETFIETYHTKLGFYPPDTPGYAMVNPLYYELSGTKLVQNMYVTLDGSGQIPALQVKNFFFNPSDTTKFVAGFMNSTKGAVGDEAGNALNFMKGLKPDQIGDIGGGIKVLVCSIPWPDNNPWQPILSPPAPRKGLNPWRYNSSNPTNNPRSYDLWVDVIVGGKTNRICNWSDQPLIVGAP